MLTLDDNQLRISVRFTAHYCQSSQLRRLKHIYSLIRPSISNVKNWDKDNAMITNSLIICGYRKILAKYYRHKGLSMYMKSPDCHYKGISSRSRICKLFDNVLVLGHHVDYIIMNVLSVLLVSLKLWERSMNVPPRATLHWKISCQTNISD